MKVLITGGTGFVGGHVARAVIAAGHEVRLLVRPGSEKKLPAGLGAEPAPGDVLNQQSLNQAATGCGAVINLVGIIREFPKKGVTFDLLHRQAPANIVAACRTENIPRLLHMSALGARPDSSSPYQATKAAGERLVRESGLAWTIFRPSLIFGPEDQSINTFAGQVRRMPLVPVIGSGRYLLQPVSVETVAAAYARSLDHPGAVGQSFDVTGPTAYTYDDILRAIGRVLDRRVRLIHLPVWPVRLATRLFGSRPSFPLTEPQLNMLLEGSAADGSRLYHILNLDPIPFEEGLSTYLKD